MPVMGATEVDLRAENFARFYRVLEYLETASNVK